MNVGVGVHCINHHRLSRAFVADGTRTIPRFLPFVDMLNHHPDSGEITIATRAADESSGVRGRPETDSQNLWWEKKLQPQSNAKQQRGPAHPPLTRGFAKGDEVFWSYKRGATPFDFLYLYGMVVNGSTSAGGGGSSLDLQWSGTTKKTAVLALQLFRLINPSR